MLNVFDIWKQLIFKGVNIFAMSIEEFLDFTNKKIINQHCALIFKYYNATR